jgi:hypothetical protein
MKKLWIKLLRKVRIESGAHMRARVRRGIQLDARHSVNTLWVHEGNRR